MQKVLRYIFLLGALILNLYADTAQAQQSNFLDATSSYTGASSPVESSASTAYTGVTNSQPVSYVPSAQTTQDIAVYNFNDASTSTTDAGAANTTLLFSVDRGAGTLSNNFDADNILSTTGTVVNAGVSGGVTDPAGAALYLRPGFATPDDNGSYLNLAASTLGYTNLVLSFAAERTSTGFSSNQFQYSTNGTTYTNLGSAFDVPVISNGSNPYAATQINLSTVTGLNNITQANFRIVFSGGSGSGNIRLDNLRLTGTTVIAPELSGGIVLPIGILLLTFSALRVRARSQSNALPRS